MNQTDKQQLVETMRDQLAKAAGVLFVDYTGLKVKQANVLRSRMRAGQITYKVVKNTLMKRAVEGTPYAAVAACFKGTPTGIVIGFEDPVSPAKITFDFAKENEQLKVKGGIVDSRAISASQAEALAKLPSRAELQGTVVALANSPGRHLAAQLKHPAGRIVGAIEARVEQLTG